MAAFLRHISRVVIHEAGAIFLRSSACVLPFHNALWGCSCSPNLQRPATMLPWIKAVWRKAKSQMHHSNGRIGLQFWPKCNQPNCICMNHNVNSFWPMFAFLESCDVLNITILGCVKPNVTYYFHKISLWLHTLYKLILLIQMFCITICDDGVYWISQFVAHIWFILKKH